MKGRKISENQEDYLNLLSRYSLRHEPESEIMDVEECVKSAVERIEAEARLAVQENSSRWR